MVFATQADHSRYHMGGVAKLEGDHYVTEYIPEVYICPICGRKTLRTYCSIECVHQALQKHDWSKEELEQDLLRYDSITAIAREYNVSDNTVRKHLEKFNLPFCKEDIIQYKIKSGVLEPKIIKEKQTPTLSKPVDQINKDTLSIIATYPSIGEAARQTNLDPDKISKVCSGYEGRKTHGGFIWKYHDKVI